jgi:hypothetical protein
MCILSMTFPGRERFLSVLSSFLLWLLDMELEVLIFLATLGNYQF